MTTQTTPVAAAPAPARQRQQPRAVGFGRLTLVELRKLGDTRSGLWLLIVIGLAAVATAVILLIWGKDPDQTFQQFLTFGMLPSSVLLPVLGILSMTSEWSQRTALTTFTLVPNRARAIAAKLAAGVLIALAATVVTAGVAAAGNLIAGATGGDASWSIPAAVLGQIVLGQVVVMLMGLGFGGLLMNSPLAIVVYFALPTVWSILTSAIRGLDSVSHWLDLNVASEPLTQGTMTSAQWAHFGVAGAIWVAVPLVLGTLRAMRREVA